MKKIALFVLSSFLLISCNAQEKSKDKTKTSKETIQPKIDYKVNKEYDENGNLIRLDSTYTYYYSNIDKDAMMNDSIVKKFYKHFKGQSPFTDSFFDDFFKQDDYLEDEFFKQDFFRGNIKRNQEMMNKMLQRMDSIKNNFLLDEFPLEDKSNNSKEKN